MNDDIWWLNMLSPSAVSMVRSTCAHPFRLLFFVSAIAQGHVEFLEVAAAVCFDDVWEFLFISFSLGFVLLIFLIRLRIIFLSFAILARGKLLCGTPMTSISQTEVGHTPSTARFFVASSGSAEILAAWMAWIMGGVDAFGCESASELLPPTFWEPHPSWSPILHHPVERLSPSVSKYWGTPTKHHRQLVCNYGLQLSSSDRMIQTCSGETVSVTRWLSPVICAPNPTQITSSCSKPLALLSQSRMSSSFLKSSCTASSKKRKESSNETSWMLYVGTQSASKRSSRCNLKLLRNFLVWYEQCHVPTKLNTGVCVCVCVCA